MKSTTKEKPKSKAKSQTKAKAVAKPKAKTKAVKETKTKSSVKTQIFTYKGNLGATTDLNNGKFINNPKAGGQLGCVIDTKEIEITKEAKQMIRQARREGGSFAAMMLTKHSDGSGSSIGLMGFWKHHYGKEVSIGRDCDMSILDDCLETNIEAPQDYKDYIDKLN